MVEDNKKTEHGNSDGHRQDGKHRPPEHRVKPPRPYGS